MSVSTSSSEKTPPGEFTTPAGGTSETKVGTAYPDPVDGQNHIDYITGPRFWIITASLAMSLFLTNLEIPIVTTSLVAISDDLGGFDKVGWIISSYLLGYVGVVVIFAKLSDIFGRRALLTLSLITFIVWSAACGAAQTMEQLIVFRAFQGIGGGGNFAIATALITELVPPEKFAMYAANLSMVYALSLLLGPIIGGAISNDTTWRWVFLLNVPAAVPALLCCVLGIPSKFPYQNQPLRQRRTFWSMIGKETRIRLDVIGAALLLLASLSLTAGFEEADSRFPWRSAYVISLLTISGILWILLLLWERHITEHGKTVEPVLPWRFMQNRVMIALLLNSIFLGGPWFVAIFQLPQKFQLVYGTSALQAGVRLMPFTFAAPVGSMASAIVAKRTKVPVMYLILASAVLQTLGFALLATLPESSTAPARIYGFQFIAGFGCGMNINLLVLTVPFTVEFADKAVGMGAVSQLRPMGGAIVLAIANSVFNGYVRPRLAAVPSLGTNNVNELLNGRLETLADQEQEDIKKILAHGYNLQMIVLCAFAAAQIPTTLLMFRKQQVRV